MSTPGAPIYGVRTGRSRDRRGRGIRGPLSLPGPLTPTGLTINLNRQREFDSYVLAALNSMSHAIEAAGLHVEVAVEAAPLLPESWDDPVPASIMTKKGNVHTIVLYRLPITQRAHSSADVLAIVWDVLSLRVAELLGTHPDDLLGDI